MQTIYAEEKHEGKLIDKVLKVTFPNMPVSAIYKALRKKDIRANGIRIKEDYQVKKGDKLDVYIIDDILYSKVKESTSANSGGFSIVYEDENILIVNKEQGISVHSDRDAGSETLIDNIIKYISENTKIRTRAASTFIPSLCHRIDRNTGGLVIIAKNAESLKILLEKIKNREIEKYYQCLVKGKMAKEKDEFMSYLTKDENKSRVFISDSKAIGSLKIITRYNVLSYDKEKDISRLEVELVTGRTHQIRAHLAHLGHPIIGDGKYGTNAINRPLGAKQQALWAYKLVFNLKQAGHLNYLKEAIFEVKPDF